MKLFRPIALLDIELSEPLKDLCLSPRYGAAQALVRLRDEPLGCVELQAHNDRLSAPAVRAAIEAQLAAAINRRYLLSRGQSEIAVSQLHAVLAKETGPGLWEALLVRQVEAQVCETPVLPAISLVVCTRDRPLDLERCLESLARLDYPRYEVVVVDNASGSGATAEAARRAGVRYVREERPGLDWARNCGAQAAAHDLIAYTDDDVQVDAGWLRGIARAFADPEVEAVTGLVMPFEAVRRHGQRVAPPDVLAGNARRAPADRRPHGRRGGQHGVPPHSPGAHRRLRHRP